MSTEATAGGDFSRNTAVMAAGTALSRLTGFGRVFALAYALGLTRVTDSYNLANTTPNIVYELVVGGVLSATLLPVFVRLHATAEEDEAWQGASAIVTMVVVIVVALSVVLALGAPVFIRLYTLANHGASAHDQRVVATFLLRLFAPQVAFYGLVTVSTALLHAHRRFALPMFAPVLNNLVVIAVLLTFPHVAGSLSLTALAHDRGALLWLGLGTTAGVAAMAAPQWLAALRRGGGRLRFRWDPRHPAVRTVLRLSVWTLGFTAANQVAYWVVLLLANRHSGDLSAYQAAYQYFFLLPHGIIAVSLMSALQPDLAEHWSLGRVDEFRARLSTGLRTLIAVLLPAAVGYITLARPIVQLLLGHGAMSSGDVRIVADVLVMMGLGLPAFSAYLLLMRAYQAMQDTRQVFLLYLVENAVNIVLALVLYPSMGVRGLALAFTLAYAAGTAAALFTIRRRIGGLEGRALARSVLRVGVASAAMAVVTLLSARFVGAASGPWLALRVTAGVVAGVTVYVAAARRLGVDEFFALLPLRRRGIRKGKGRPG
ncbi:MAG: putative peptidoglycan lipid flippase [Actinomycetota bacterium]